MILRDGQFYWVRGLGGIAEFIVQYGADNKDRNGRKAGPCFWDHLREVPIESVVIAQHIPNAATLQSMRSTLRRFAIVQRHRMASGGGTVHVGYRCNACGSEWDVEVIETHKDDCLCRRDQP